MYLCGRSLWKLVQFIPDKRFIGRQYFASILSFQKMALIIFLGHFQVLLYCSGVHNQIIGTFWIAKSKPVKSVHFVVHDPIVSLSCCHLGMAFVFQSKKQYNLTSGLDLLPPEAKDQDQDHTSLFSESST